MTLRKPIVGPALVVSTWVLWLPIGAPAQSVPGSPRADITEPGRGTLTVQGEPHTDTADT
jgi:hypothetical protein